MVKYMVRDFIIFILLLILNKILQGVDAAEQRNYFMVFGVGN